MAIITVSRGTFGGGQALANCLARQFGYECVSREVIVEAAALYGASAVEHLTSAIESLPSFNERLNRERSAYLDCVRAALCERAREGNLVYHGYAAHLLLPSISHVIRIRVVADAEYRIRAAMAQQNLSRKEAMTYIENVDRGRSEWARFLYAVEWDDPTLYDLVLNLSRISLDNACRVVAQMVEPEEFQPTPESLKAVRDLGLRSRVCAALAMDPRTTVIDLDVSSDDGAVFIGGTVTSQEVADAIPLVAGQVHGVREVTTGVQVGRFVPETPATYLESIGSADIGARSSAPQRPAAPGSLEAASKKAVD